MSTRTSPLRFAIACGGTGGHMFPGLAVGSALRARGHAVAVVLSGRSVESARAATSLPDGAESILVPVRPLSPRDPLSFPLMALGVLRAIRAFRRFRPDALLAMGSYTSFAPVAAARFLRIPVVLHEANAIPGDAIARLSRWFRIHTVCLTFPEAAQHLRKGPRIADTGLPLRAEFSAGIGSSKAAPDRFSLLVMGGSQGAQAVNEAVAGALAVLRDRDPGLFRRLRVTHLAGPKNADAVQSLYAKVLSPKSKVPEKFDVQSSKFEVQNADSGLRTSDSGLRTSDSLTVLGFSNEMPRHYAEADFCISRAGASSCFELALAGLPALFIPLPNLARDHQVFNAKSMAGRGAGLFAAQSGLSPESLADTLSAIASDPSRRAALRAKLLEAARPDAAERVATALEEAARR